MSYAKPHRNHAHGPPPVPLGLPAMSGDVLGREKPSGPADPAGPAEPVVPVDSASFRRALGRFATGVTVVTGLDEAGAPIGATVSAFSSLSLDPPLILFCLVNESATLASVMATKSCAINILSESQERTSRLFAGRTVDWALVEHERAENGVPVLTGCLATIQTQVQATYPGGDHAIVVAMVTAISTTDGKPLVHHQGEYSSLVGIGP